MINPGTEPLAKKKTSKIVAALVILTAIIAMGVFAASGYVGWNLTHPKREAINATPADEGLTYNDIQFKSREDNLTLSGWLLRSQANEKTVILAHGYRKNRLQNDVPALPIAKDLVSKGCNVIMFDFRNSGISDGNLTSVGQYEVRDLLGAVDYVKSQPGLNQKIILMGFSMGASTAILAGAREPAVAAVIADSPFADLNTYLNDNLSIWTELPSFPFNKAFFIVVPKLTGLRMDMVSPIREISYLSGRKLLLIHGESDVDIPIKNSEALAGMLPNTQLLRVPEAGHVKSYATATSLYLNTVNNFISRI